MVNWCKANVVVKFLRVIFLILCFLHRDFQISFVLRFGQFWFSSVGIFLLFRKFRFDEQFFPFLFWFLFSFFFLFISWFWVSLSFFLLLSGFVFLEEVVNRIVSLSFKISFEFFYKLWPVIVAVFLSWLYIFFQLLHLSM